MKGDYLSEPDEEIKMEETETHPKTEIEKRTDKEGFIHPRKVIKIVDNNTNPTWTGTNIYNNLENEEINVENSQYENENTTTASTSNENTNRKRNFYSQPISIENKNTTPLILRTKEKWIEVSAKLHNNKIKYTKATSTTEGIRIQPESEDDFRKMYKMLKKMNA